MSDAQIAAILSRLDKIDERLRQLEIGAVTWKTLLLSMTAVAAVVASIVTAGNQLWS